MAQHPRRLSTLLLCVAACTSLPTALAFAPTIVSSKSPTLVRRQETSNSQLGVSVEPLQEAWASYNVALEQSPLLVKSLSAGVILGAADLAGQAIESVRNANDETSSSSEEESGGIDVARFVRFAVFGLVLQAVSWYPRLEDPNTAVVVSVNVHSNLCLLDLDYSTRENPSNTKQSALESLLLHIIGRSHSSNCGTIYFHQLGKGCH